MKKDLINFDIINYKEGLQRCVSNEELYEMLLASFLQDDNYSLGLQAYEAKDYEKMLFHFHSLKGISANLSIVKVFAASSQIVVLLRAKEYDKIDGGISEVAVAYAEACAHIKEILEG